ncbi:MAG: helicase HerA domain-containing protein [Candidatus Thorarchaeota archaeon]
MAWSQTIEDATTQVQSMSSVLTGSLRTESTESDFSIQLTSKKRIVERLLQGQPAGPSTILTSDEVVSYLGIPQVDLGLRVSRKADFSSNVQETSTNRPVRTENESVVLDEHRFRIKLGDLQADPGSAINTLELSPDELRQHLAVLGVTGTGKTTTIINIISQSINLGIHTTIICPEKSYEYRPLLNVSPDTRYFAFGRNNLPPLLFNIWKPPKNVSLRKWINRVVQVWTLYLSTDPVLSLHIEHVIHAMYERCGWDIRTNTHGRAILLQDFLDAIQEVTNELSYGDEVTSNIGGALRARSLSILRRDFLVDIMNTKVGVSVEELLNHTTIIDLDGLFGDDKVLIMGLITAMISEYKLANPSPTLSNLLVLEEAHYLLGTIRTENEIHAGVRYSVISSFIQMLRVLGRPGLGIVLVDQSPTSLVPEALKVTVNLIIHALSDSEDRKLVGRHSRCSDAQIEHIGGMQPGEAVVYLQREREPKYIKILNPRDSLSMVDDDGVREHMARLEASSDLRTETATANPPRNDVSGEYSASLEEQMKSVVNGKAFRKLFSECVANKDIHSLHQTITRILQKAMAKWDVSFREALVSLTYPVFGLCRSQQERKVLMDAMLLVAGAKG